MAGICDLGKGALGPVLAGPDRPVLSAVAAGAAVAGHDWSPFLGGAGGRGIAPAVGAMLVTGWPGAFILLGGNWVGRVLRHTGLGGFLAIVALPPTLARMKGRRAALVAAGVAVPMLLKRMAGNRPPVGARGRAYLTRLVLDRDPTP